MNFIKILPLSKSRLDVLLEIYISNQTYLRDIAKKLKMNPSLCHRIIKRLFNAKFLMKEQKGKEILYSFNKNKDYKILITILEEYHLEKIMERTKILQTVINFIFNNKDLINSSEKIYLFGSYVVGDYTTKSDIDLLFVSNNRKLIMQICREISSITGIEINPLIYTKRKFEAELLEKEAFLSSVINNIKNRAIIK